MLQGSSDQPTLLRHAILGPCKYIALAQNMMQCMVQPNVHGAEGLPASKLTAKRCSCAPGRTFLKRLDLLLRQRLLVAWFAGVQLYCGKGY